MRYKYCVCKPLPGDDFMDSISDIKSYSGVYIVDLKVWVVPDMDEIQMAIENFAIFLGEFESEFPIHQNSNLYIDVKSCV